MSTENILQPIKGIEPFDELEIDESIWREAHEHHHLHRKLHATRQHRPGIFYGLEVFISPTNNQTLVIAPGVAIDPLGQTLILEEKLEFNLDQKGEIYIVIYFQKAYDRSSKKIVGSGEKYFRIQESRKVEPTQRLPKHPYLELARIERTGSTKPIFPARDPFDPKVDELNLMHRLLAFPYCLADGGVGDICLLPVDHSVDWKPNRSGLWNMIQEANAKNCHLSFVGVQSLTATPTAESPFLLYSAGSASFQQPSTAQLDGLDVFLSNGGTLLLEDCGQDSAFAKQATEILSRRGVNLKPVQRGNPLLTSHHVFANPPSGRNPNGSFFADLDKGVLLSTYDYGGAWQGNVQEAFGRSAIRDAQEFGINIMIWAARRKRLTRLCTLS